MPSCRKLFMKEQRGHQLKNESYLEGHEIEEVEEDAAGSDASDMSAQLLARDTYTLNADQNGCGT